MSDSEIYGEPDTGRLAALLFELGAQLHVERTQRLALEAALVRAGVLAPDAIAGLAGDPELSRSSRAELDMSMRKLMRVLIETPDVRTPLRGEAASEKH